MTNNTSGTNQNITENVDDVGTETANVSNAEGISDVCFDITEEGTLIINKPAQGVIQPIAVEEGQNYVFNVNPSTITGTEVSGENLVVKFDNGSSVILENYSVASNGSEASLNFMDGRTFTLAELVPAIEPLVPEEELEEPQAEIREESAEASDESGETSGDDGIQISQTEELSAEELNEVAEELAETEPAAGDDLAAQLANIEPAAGDAGAAGGNSGYGFESSFQAQGVIPLEDVGPINPTELQYNLPQVEDTLFIEEDPGAPPPIDPSVEFDNQQVL